jgi:uncharacterized protein (TIGR04255 family)
MSQPLPEFDQPPVIEVVLGVQFEKLGSLGAPQLGYVWHVFRERFPRTEGKLPLDPAFEHFGPRAGRRPGVQMQLMQAPPEPRLWFLNERGTELVQVQPDRFVRNWRKREDTEEYPRYEKLRESFQQDFEEFRGVICREQWGDVEPNQCEVTYVNLIPADEGWQHHGDLDKVLTVFSARYSDDHLHKPEQAAVSLQYVLKDDKGEPAGRLRIAAEPVLRVSDNRPAIRLSLTARGKPERSTIEDAMAFLDRGHEAVVRGFTSITTPEMHKVWKRTS